jgi:hypothetical protein
MNPNDVAPMIVATTLIIVTGAVALLRPIAKRLGAYLEAVTFEKQKQPQKTIEPRIVETLERMDERLRLLEERLDFTDSLLSRTAAAERPALPRRPTG